MKYIDLFTGMGGIRLGFEQALNELGLKGTCVLSAEVKSHAIKVYKDNYNEDPHLDVTKIVPSEVPDFDFLLGGFPCQPFSRAGKYLGFEDTRGTLFFNIANIIKTKKPKGFLLENVEGLINHDKGNTLKVILATLEELGYSVEYAVLDSSDFGLAQKRKRVYIIGVNKGKCKPLSDFKDFPNTAFGDIIDYDTEPEITPFTEKLLENFDVEHLFGKSIKDKRGGVNNIHSWDIGVKGPVSDEQKELLDLILKKRRSKKWAKLLGIEWSDGMPLTLDMIKTFHENKTEELLEDLVDKGYLKMEHPKKKVGTKRVQDTTQPLGYNIVTGNLSFEFSKILDPKGKTNTIVATDAVKLAVPLPNGIRKLSRKEGLRLFGFPDDYILDSVSDREVYDLLGNTVCVPVIKEVSLKLLQPYLHNV